MPGSTAIILALVGVQLTGLFFWVYQNRARAAVGGGLSFIKGLWLTYAITLWFVLPGLLFFWLPAGIPRMIFGLLALSMLLRGLVELVLCYITKTWKVAYGVSHDLLHILLVLICGVYYFMNGSTAPGGDDFVLLGILVLTLLALLTELLFVRWFLDATGGPEAGVYFVSGAEEFNDINRNTALLFLPQYGIFFYGLALVVLS